jgi:hypothetical protein
VEDDEPFTLDAAWENLRYLAQFLFRLFATPAELAAQMLLRKAKRVEILQWLAPLEAAARRLILLEALALPKPNASAPPSPCGFIGNTFADRPPPDFPENAEAWRVHFHVFRASPPSPAPQEKRTQNTNEMAGGGIRYDAIALARRIEALRRVLENRAAAVRHLAARVLGGPREVKARAARCFAPYRYKPGAARSLLPALQREVDVALARLNSS